MYVSSDASDEPLLKSNMFSLGGAKFFGAVNRSINLGRVLLLCVCSWLFSPQRFLQVRTGPLVRSSELLGRFLKILALNLFLGIAQLK